MVVKWKCKDCGNVKLITITRGTRKVAHMVKQNHKNSSCQKCSFRRFVKENMKRGFMK